MRNSSIYRLLFLGLILVAVPHWAMGQIVDPQHPKDTGHTPKVEKVTACASCHKCDHPTPDDPCMINCPRHGSHFYGQHEADEGPEIVIIDQLADLYRPVVFAHRLHADMSNMTGGCENCHHYSEQSGVIPPCRECHDATKGPVSLNQPALKGAYHRQCMNCHRDWSHESACGFCHEQVHEGIGSAIADTTDIVGIPHPKIEAVPTYTYETSCDQGALVTFHHNDHVDMFGLKCVDCHRGDSCSRCHDAGLAQHQRLNHLTTCCACHGERNCAFCHTVDPKPMFEHTRTAGWALDPHHTDVACNTCHGSPQDFRTPSDKCTSCHIHWEVGSFDHKVTGLSLSEDHEDLDCSDCHLEMDFSTRPSCEDCHDEPMLPEQLPGTRL
jgi:hypothetical protein